MKIRQADRIPWWAGYSYTMMGQPLIVVYPVPINWLVRWYRCVVTFLKYRGFKGWEEAIARESRNEVSANWGRIIPEIREQAYQAGYRDGAASTHQNIQELRDQIRELQDIILTL